MKNQGLRLRDFNLFDKRNSLNCVVTPEGNLTLFALFLPILLELLLKNLMNTVTVFIMSNVSDDAVASIGVATQLMNIFIMFYMVIGSGATVAINQYLGAEKKQRAYDASTAVIYVCIALAVVIGGLVSILAEPLIRMMQLEERLIPDAALYLRIALGVSVFNAIMTSAMAVCRAYGNTLYPVLVSLLMNIINAGLGYIVVFRPFEIPLVGVGGIAAARVLSEAVSCIVMLALLKKVQPELRYLNKSCLSLTVLRDIFKIGLPRGIQSFSFSMSQTVTTAVLAGLGAATVSCKVYLTNILYYSYLLGSALGQANSLMVGRLIGQREFDRAYRMTLRNLVVTLTLNAAFASVLALFRYQLLGMFTEDPTILTLGAAVMIIDIFVEIGRGMNHTFEGSLTAAGDVRVPMISGMCTSWCFSVLTAYVLGVKLGMGLYGCWIGFGLDEVVRGCIYIWRWRSGAWRSKSLV